METTTPDKALSPERDDEHVLRVLGMTCSGCVRSVSAAVERVAPGTLRSLDLASGVARLSAAADRHAVAVAIADAGFDVVD